MISSLLQCDECGVYVDPKTREPIRTDPTEEHPVFTVHHVCTVCRERPRASFDANGSPIDA